MSEEKRPRLGIFGGSFHPPHQGHVEAAELFLDKAELDFLFVIPAADPPHKRLAKGASADDRFEMTKIAMAPLGARVRVLRLELDDPALRYSVDTANSIAASFPEHELYLYVGSDLFLTFEEWHEFEQLLSLCHLAVLARENDLDAVQKHAEYLHERYGARVLILGQSRVISSGEIRKKLAKGKKPACVHANVLEYIENGGLYRQKESE